MPQLFGYLFDGAPVTIRRRRIEAGCKRAAHRLDIASAGGGENAVAPACHTIDLIDMRLQRTPAFEAVVVGNSQLPLMSFASGARTRSSASRFFAAFLNQSRSGFAGNACGMGHLLSMRPATAILVECRRAPSRPGHKARGRAKRQVKLPGHGAARAS